MAVTYTRKSTFTLLDVDDTVSNVTSSSTTLVGGIDGQTLTKTSDFSLEITITITYSDNS